MAAYTGASIQKPGQHLVPSSTSSPLHVNKQNTTAPGRKLETDSEEQWFSARGFIPQRTPGVIWRQFWLSQCNWQPVGLSSPGMLLHTLARGRGFNSQHMESHKHSHTCSQDTQLKRKRDGRAADDHGFLEKQFGSR